jgi:hypothetical protein
MFLTLITDHVVFRSRSIFGADRDESDEKFLLQKEKKFQSEPRNKKGKKEQRFS